MNEQFKPFRNLRIILFAFGQRANTRGVIGDKYWADQCVFDFFFEHVVLDDIAMSPLGFDSQRLSQFGDCVVIVRIDSSVFRKQLVVCFPLERQGKIDLFVAPGQRRLATDRFDRIGNNILGEVHHRVVIAVGLIDLHHGEFRIVLGAGSLVAIDSTHFENPFHTADHQTLEMQLQRNSHVELHVQSVVMSLEGPCRRSTGDSVQSRSFDLDKPFST